ncbi:hypothetical protein D3C79_1067060 [compost metagenome]
MVSGLIVGPPENEREVDDEERVGQSLGDVGGEPMLCTVDRLPEQADRDLTSGRGIRG